MRIELLRLLSFGPFEGTTLHFGRHAGIDVIFGPNEAGKSSTRRAVLGLLFGIPDRSTDGHSVRGEVRVGATLRNEHGETLEIIRRKARKNSLLSPSQEPIGESVLQKWLGGIDHSTFELTYGLDHERLRKGGDALRVGKGELGESLFSATTGMTGLHALLVKLRTEAEELYVPRGQRPALNEALRAYATSKKDAIDLATAPEKWVETQRQIEDAQKTRDDLVAERAALVQQRARVEAVAVTERERKNAVLRVRHLEVAITDVNADLSALAPDPDLLAHAEAILRLQERLGSHRKARDDRPSLAGKLVALRDEAKRTARTVRADATLDDVAGMRVDRPSEVHLRKLAREGTTLRTRRQQLAAREAASREAVDEARARLSALPEPHLAPALHAALAVARREGDVSARVLAAEGRAKSVRRAAEALRATLAPFRGTLEEALLLALPSAEAVLGRVRAAQRLDERRRDLVLRQRRLGEERIDAERDLAALHAEGDIPVEDDLRAARAERDGAFSEFRTAKSKTAAAADKVSRAMAHADDLADRLRREAARVTRRAQLESTLVANAKKIAAMESELGALTTEESDERGAWAAMWTDGIIPLAPAEMSAWLGKFETFRAAVREALDAEHTAEALRTSERHATTALRAALGEGNDLTLAALERMATTRIAEADALLAKRATEEGALREAERDRAQMARAHGEWDAEHATWRAEWSRATAGLGLGDDPGVEELLAVLDALAEVERRLDEADGIERRLAGIDRDATLFVSAVRAECEACAQDLAVRAAEDACPELARRAARAAELRVRRDALSEQHAKLEAQLREARSIAEEATVIVARAVAEADVHETLAETRSAELGQRLEELDEAARRAERNLGGLKAGVPAFIESPAVEKAAQAERDLARVRELAERWARARLAAAAVAKLLDRHRSENQGPLLARAGELFARLTLGSFRTLEVGFGESEEPTLVAVRGERRLETPALSDGTLDQLYLALRIASLERLAKARGPMPLLLDDALVHFDDERAAAALAALAELAQTTQVLLFTHHARIVELARRLPETAVHELRQETASATVN